MSPFAVMMKRIAGDAHGAPAGPDEHFHALVEDVIGALEADLVVPKLDVGDAREFLLSRRLRLEPFQLLFERRDRHGVSSAICVVVFAAFKRALWRERTLCGATPLPLNSPECRDRAGRP